AVGGVSPGPSSVVVKYLTAPKVSSGTSTITSRYGSQTRQRGVGSRCTPWGTRSCPRTSNSSCGYGYSCLLTCAGYRLAGGREAPCRALLLAARSHAPQSFDEHRLGGERLRGVDQGVEHLVV